MNPLNHPFVFHLVQAVQWQQAQSTGAVYFPPTYEQDGFTHGTSDPEKLLKVANRFYARITGDWLCLKMTVQRLAESGVQTVFEEAAPVGDIQPGDAGAGSELFPHILGGIHADAVIEIHAVARDAAGNYLSITGVTAT